MLFQKAVRREVEKQLAEISVKPEAILPKTYAALPEIRRGMYRHVYVPFGEAHVWMELRSLNATQIQECGDIALIEIVVKKGTAGRAEALELRNTLENLAKAVMNSPTWAEFEALVYGRDNVIRERRAELAALKERVEADPALERRFRGEIESLEVFVGYLLPENTLHFLAQYALGLDVSDVKKLSSDKLLEAAVWARRHTGKPHEYFEGAVLTDRDRNEIDNAAAVLYFEKYERNTIGRRRKNERKF
jgi:hypothetical protein